MPDFIVQMSTAAAIAGMIYGFYLLGGRLLIDLGDYLESRDTVWVFRDTRSSGDV